MFLSKSDFDSVIHLEILNAITRENDDLINKEISAAVSLVKSYLSARYDTTAIFAATGSARNEQIMQIIKDIVIYRLFCAHNPQKMTEMRRVNYEDAISTLGKIQAQKINPALPLLVTEQPQKNYIQYGGNAKRSHHY